MEQEPGRKMKGRSARLLAVGAGCAVIGALGGGVATWAASTPKPEIDRANANIQLGGALKSITCKGEDKTTYITYVGSWAGGESQVTPDPTDYPLSGTLTVSGIDWTINQSTGRGVLTGKAVLVATTSTGTETVYSGKLVVVTQGLPATGANVSGRGFLDAPILLPDEGVTPGDDSLVANIEFPSMSPGGAAGWFGDLPGAPGVPDFSVVTNVVPASNNEAC